MIDLGIVTLAIRSPQRRDAFTLIELLIVIAIIAILSVVVILVLNPASLLQQSRDSNRVADLANINEALNIYAEDQGGSFGNASTTYISIPDPTATSTAGDQCQGLGLPTLIPTSTTYHCAASSTYRNPNSTGWIPVNFQSISIGSPLSVLPIDPTNTTSSGLYYAYIPGQSSANSYELLSRMESAKYTNTSGGAAANDGGYSNQYDEVGKDLTLALTMPTNLNRLSTTDYLQFDQNGLVGYWPLNEGAGSTAYDQSGNGNNGTWSGTQAGSSGYYSPGIVGKWGGYFNGSNNFIPVLSMSTSSFGNGHTFTAWVNATTLNVGYNMILSFTRPYFSIYTNHLMETISVGGVDKQIVGNATLGTGTSYFLAATYNNAVQTLYVNGVFDSSSSASGAEAFTANLCIGDHDSSGCNNSGFPFTGLIGDVRIYNRALSAQEVAAMYNGGL